ILTVSCLSISAAAEASGFFLLGLPELFLLSRLVVGAGCGAIYTAVLSIVGINGNAERVFGISTALCMATLSIITVGAGYIYSNVSVGFGIIFVALITLMFAPFFLKMPSQPDDASDLGKGLPHLVLGLWMGAGFLFGKMALGLGAAFVV